jgi:hypothetical protein
MNDINCMVRKEKRKGQIESIRKIAEATREGVPNA